MRKALLGLLAAVLATVGAARLAYEATAERGSGPVAEAWAQGTMEFVGWNSVRWTTWVVSGEFVQIPQQTGRWSRHTNASIAYVDWDGVPHQAKVDGDAFLLAEHGDWNGHVERSEAIRYRDWESTRQLRTIAQLTR